ncbi:MAG TPA: methyltransferase domain-containing protein [Candidatus Acidoferrales bacterium]|nr:methyltransferase domain-containing protein [Candidatus Acidoferrales bacterium]
MRRDFVDLLACPRCRGAIELQTPTTEPLSIDAGDLVCSQCGRSFPVLGGIPRLLDKIREPSTAEHFAFEWRSFPEISELYEKQFLDWIHPIDRDFFRGKTVLDAGCGKGRHLLLAARFGARRVVGLDVSDAVEIARRNTDNLANVDILQADLCHPPLRRAFDYIYCIGVLHHLAQPRAGFKALCELLRPGGTISIWVYGREGNGWIVYLVDPLRKLLTASLPLTAIKALSWPLAAWLFALCRLIYRPANIYAKPLARFLFYNDYLEV